MACSKCGNTLTLEDIKSKLTCDFCYAKHCVACSGLSSSECRVTQLSKRSLFFACKACIGLVKVCDNKIEASLNSFQLEIGNSIEQLKHGLEKTFNDRIDKLFCEMDKKTDQTLEKMTLLVNQIAISVDSGTRVSRDVGVEDLTAEPVPASLPVSTNVPLASTVVQGKNGQCDHEPETPIRQNILSLSQVNRAFDAVLNNKFGNGGQNNGNDGVCLVEPHLLPHAIHKGKENLKGGRNSGNKGNKNSPIVGTAKELPSGISLAAAVDPPKKAQLHVTNLAVGCTAESVTNYILAKQPEVTSVRVQSLKPRYDHYTAFKVDVDEKFRQTLLSSEFWPEKVKIRNFSHGPNWKRGK